MSIVRPYSLNGNPALNYITSIMRIKSSISLTGSFHRRAHWDKREIPSAPKIPLHNKYLDVNRQENVQVIYQQPCLLDSLFDGTGPLRID